jgi:hypothetical protein
VLPAFGRFDEVPGHLEPLAADTLHRPGLRGMAFLHLGKALLRWGHLPEAASALSSARVSASALRRGSAGLGRGREPRLDATCRSRACNSRSCRQDCLLLGGLSGPPPSGLRIVGRCHRCQQRGTR